MPWMVSNVSGFNIKLKLSPIITTEWLSVKEKSYSLKTCFQCLCRYSSGSLSKKDGCITVAYSLHTNRNDSALSNLPFTTVFRRARVVMRSGRCDFKRATTRRWNFYHSLRILLRRIVVHSRIVMIATYALHSQSACLGRTENRFFMLLIAEHPIGRWSD